MEAQVVSVKKIYGDGHHNAFTDLTEWRGDWYVTFRSGMSHDIAGYGNVVVLRSKDHGESWEHCAILDTGMDDRDPKLLDCGDQLGLIFGSNRMRSQEAGRSLTTRRYDMITHVAASRNGSAWSVPIQVGPPCHWIWSVCEIPPEMRLFWADTLDLAEEPIYVGASYDTNAGRYAAIYLHVASSLLNWEMVGPVLESRDYDLSEPALFFERIPGENRFRLVVLIRTEGYDRYPVRRLTSVVSLAPDEMELTHLPRFTPEMPWGVEIHSPCIQPWFGGYLLAGRSVGDAPVERGSRRRKEVCKTVLYAVKKNELILLCEFPSGGDNGYPGMIVNMAENRVYMSYYSQHEVPAKNQTWLPSESNIYLATIDLPVERGHDLEPKRSQT